MSIAALMLLEGAADYDRGRNHALEGQDYVGPSPLTLGSRYDEGYEDGKREREAREND